MKSIKQTQKGITLIALIITIIVLLILAGVTINLTLGENGIFKTAEMAGKNYAQAQEDELAGLAGFQNEINNVLENIGNNSTDTPVTNYETLKSVAKSGDYVKYDTGINTVGDNGKVTFRVLYNDDTYGLQIISDKNIENVTLGTDGDNDLTAWQASMNDYNNAIAILNQKAEYYAQSSPYAIDGRSVGSVPTIGEDGKYNAKNTENVGPVQLQFSTTVEGANNMKEEDENYTTDQTAMESANIWITGENYWLASRIVSQHSSSCGFHVRYVRTSGILDNIYLCYVVSDGSTGSLSGEYGLRPCISLKPDVKVVGGGDGSSEAQAYELGI